MRGSSGGCRPRPGGWSAGLGVKCGVRSHRPAQDPPYVAVTRLESDELRKRHMYPLELGGLYEAHGCEKYNNNKIILI